MSEYRARAYRADWLNAWLAAIGAAVLCEDLTLRWSDDAKPAAVFGCATGDVIERIAESLPSVEGLRELAIARSHPLAEQEMTRNFGLDVYVKRAEISRLSGDQSLSVSVTDLTELDGDLPHSPFDVSVPKGLTLHDRVVACRSAIHDPVADVTQSLSVGQRTGPNGLGFDVRRMAGGVHAHAEKTTDPVVELLAFYGLFLFPVRGSGGRNAVARGWVGRPTRPGSFRWMTWEEPLDRWGIDAALDRYQRTGRADQQFESVPYQALGSLDVTRAYGSRRRP